MYMVGAAFDVAPIFFVWEERREWRDLWAVSGGGLGEPLPRVESIE